MAETPDYKTKYFQWKMEGFDVASVEPLLEEEMTEGVKKEFEAFENKIDQLKKLEEELLTLEKEGVEDDILKIRAKLRSPEKIEQIKKDIQDLRTKIREGMFMSMVKGGFQVVPEAAAEKEAEKAKEAPAATGSPVPADKKDDGPTVLKRGYSYLINDDTSETSYTIFSQHLKKTEAEGSTGMIITRDFPESVRRDHGFAEEFPIYWLSNVEKDYAIKPVDLGTLYLQIETFLKGNGHPVVLLSGLEYLITQNNYVSVLKFLQLVNEQTAVHKAMLIVPISPSAMDEQSRKLIEREMKLIKK